MLHGLIGCRKRRASPEWTHTPEALLMALRPTLLTRHTSRPTPGQHPLDSVLPHDLHAIYARCLQQHCDVRPVLPSTTALQHTGHTGVGFVSLTHKHPATFSKMFTAVLLRCRCLVMVPSDWHRCKSVPLDKHGSVADGAKAVRLIHIFGGVPGGYFRGLQREHPLPPQPSWSYGSLPGVSRERAILR
jgi:hypothetical protein